jgi:hypothetical protein
MRTDRDGAPLASVDAEDAAQRAAEAIPPYQVLSPRQALLEAARLNREALMLMAAKRPTEAWEHARIAWSLSAYAEAQRWAP